MAKPLGGVRRLARAAAAVLLLPLGAAAMPAGAGVAAAHACVTPPLTVQASPWAAPLDRHVSLHLRNVPLRDALDRLAAAARLRFSYNDDLLPLEREVCASFHDAAVGDVLVSLLDGVAVAPVSGGADHVILAPTPARDASLPPARPAYTLDRIVVTGSASGASQRELPVALSIIGRRALDASPEDGVAALMDAGVPGVWLWPQGPAGVVAAYGSIRGASSFGVTSPKIYIDGIQVANPLLFTQMPGTAIERVEVIRGPQGTALYGADALSGVVNVVTRREHPGSGAPVIRLRSSLGIAQSAYAPAGTVTQRQTIALRAGSDVRSGGLDVDIGSTGAYMPRVYERHLSADGNARLVARRSIFTGTARLFVQDAGVPISPLLRDSLAPLASDTATGRLLPVFARDSVANPQALREYTLGGSATFAQNERWTHSAVLGIDGYSLSGVVQELLPVPSAADSALNAARGSANRASLRLSSVARFGDELNSATLTFAAERSALQERTAGAAPGPLARSGAGDIQVNQWLSTSALVAQAQAGLRGALFLTGGLRLEHNGGLTAGDRTDLLPMLGSALVRAHGPLTVKLRAAWGRAVRPAQTPLRETMWTEMHRQLTAALEPERQSGWEAGVDVLLGSALTLQVTRYDQLASGLIQSVALTDSAGMHHGGMPGDSARRELNPPMRYVLQNVGSITNRGWEAQATSTLGRLWLSASWALADSRVRDLAAGYAGDLRAGDRVLGVPRWTAALSAGWTGNGWAASAAAYRAHDWIQYDRMAIARQYLGTGQASELTGAALRAFWLSYDGVTHLRAAASRDLPHGLALQITGDNLLDRQFGEPDNITVLPGRSFTLGLRASF